VAGRGRFRITGEADHGRTVMPHPEARDGLHGTRVGDKSVKIMVGQVHELTPWIRVAAHPFLLAVRRSRGLSDLETGVA